MRQIVCIYLPTLSIDLALRQEPYLRDKPLVLVDALSTHEVVVAASMAARTMGIFPEMTIAVARSRCSDLILRPFDLNATKRGYQALARWIVRRYSPVVAIEVPAIIAEIGGSTRLLGGAEFIADDLRRRLKVCRLTSIVAVAPTVGAAWALASMNKNDVVSSDALLRSLKPLPVRALRIDAGTANRLHHVGIETVGQLMELPRAALPSRFGTELLRRLDQATGSIPEVIVPLVDEQPVYAEISSDEPITSAETIWHALGELTDQIINQLACRSAGVTRLRLILRPAYASPIEKIITLSRPSRDSKSLYRLMCLALEHLEAREGFVSIRFEVLRLQRIVETQRDFIGDDDRDRITGLEDLADRLQARLGNGAVLCPRLVESYLPEQACAWVPWQQQSEPQTSSVQSVPRPLQLQNPVEIAVVVAPSEDREGRPILFRHGNEVFPIAFAAGPERISGLWWNCHNKTRDYFDVEDDAGRRFWIFRVLETRKWYLHGHF